MTFLLYPRANYNIFAIHRSLQSWWAEAGDKSSIEFIRRLVFNLAIGNADMHLKNWSVIYRDPQKPEIAPAYDFVSTIAYVDDPHLGLRLGRTKNMYEIEMEDFMHLAEKSGIPKMLVRKTVTETIEAFKDIWQQRASELLLSRDARNRIEAHQQKLRLFTPGFSADMSTKRAIRSKKSPKARKRM